MNVQQQVSLKFYNSFGIDVAAQYFAAFTSVEELKELLTQHRHLPLLVLGGGSNILFTQPFHGLVLRNELMGIGVVKEDETHFYVKSAAGENWHQLVMYCVAHDYAGLENLSLIPGSVGASPIQNIGAYGVELKDVFSELEVLDIATGQVITFSKEDCRFGYRDSVFKHKYKGRFIILSVTFQLFKQPVFHTEYGAIQEELQRMNASQLSIAAISQAVINIRRSKLPDPQVIGNAGSFFKNPTVPNEQYALLKEEYPSMPGYAADENHTKLAAGWLIEHCGWKGYRAGDVGCYSKQALVLVNYGKATGAEVYRLSEQIIDSVNRKFAVPLEREVNII